AAARSTAARPRTAMSLPSRAEPLIDAIPGERHSVTGAAYGRKHAAGNAVADGVHRTIAEDRTHRGGMRRTKAHAATRRVGVVILNGHAVVRKAHDVVVPTIRPTLVVVAGVDIREVILRLQALLRNEHRVGRTIGNLRNGDGGIGIRILALEDETVGPRAA